MNRIRPLILLLILAALTGLVVKPVQAHAILVSSIPEANAMLASSPAQIELYFSEAVEGRLSKISVLDSSGKHMEAGDSRVDPSDPTHLVVSLSPLTDGVYTVSWRVISATDGHQTSGSFPFAVGNVNPGMMSTVQQATSFNPLPPGSIITKGLLYLVAATLIGGMLFARFVWNPSFGQAVLHPEDQDAYLKFSQRLIFGALIILEVADIVSLLAQAGQVNGTLFVWPWKPTFVTVLLETRFGVIAIARLCLAFILAGLLLPYPNRWNRWAGLAACMLLLLTFSLGSHAAGESRPILPVLADWIHITAISVWIGGLFSFLGGMRSTRRLDSESRTRLTSVLIPHFTLLAMTSVGVLTITGVYASIIHFGTLKELLNTDYGRALIVKFLIAAPMLGMGGIHFLITTPTIRRAAKRPGGSLPAVTHFQALLTVEALLGMILLIWVAVFTTLPPARIPVKAAGINQTTKINDLTVALNIAPGRTGMNTFTATVSSGGHPVTDAQSVSLEFRSLSGMVMASQTTLDKIGAGMYNIQGGYLGMPAQWDIKVVIVRPGKFDAYADYTVDTNPTVAPSRALPWRSIALVLLVATAISVVFVFLVMVRRSPAEEWRWI